MFVKHFTTANSRSVLTHLESSSFCFVSPSCNKVVSNELPDVLTRFNHSETKSITKCVNWNRFYNTKIRQNVCPEFLGRKEKKIFDCVKCL